MSSLLILLLACSTGFDHPERELAEAPSADGPLHPVTIHAPPTVGAVDTTRTDVHGTPLAVGCETCHGGALPLAQPQGNPEDFHGDLAMAHGELSCGACHSDDRLGLHLADGERLEFGDAMRLCAQCHGPQTRDYEHGSHGGMTGYWDLRQGPRERNHCLDCHGAHSPQIRAVQPAEAPLDRGRIPSEEH